MKTVVTTLLALVVALPSAFGAPAADPPAADRPATDRDAERSAGRIFDDARLSTSVKAKLVADRLSNFTKVDVRVKNGIVRLGGRVDTPEDRSRVETLARRTDGVLDVVNEIEVRAAPSASPR